MEISSIDGALSASESPPFRNGYVKRPPAWRRRTLIALTWASAVLSVSGLVAALLGVPRSVPVQLGDHPGSLEWEHLAFVTATAGVVLGLLWKAGPLSSLLRILALPLVMAAIVGASLWAPAPPQSTWLEWLLYHRTWGLGLILLAQVVVLLTCVPIDVEKALLRIGAAAAGVLAASVVWTAVGNVVYDPTDTRWIAVQRSPISQLGLLCAIGLVMAFSSAASSVPRRSALFSWMVAGVCLSYIRTVWIAAAVGLVQQLFVAFISPTGSLRRPARVATVIMLSCGAVTALAVFAASVREPAAQDGPGQASQSAAVQPSVMAPSSVGGEQALITRVQVGLSSDSSEWRVNLWKQVLPPPGLLGGSRSPSVSAEFGTHSQFVNAATVGGWPLAAAFGTFLIWSVVAARRSPALAASWTALIAYSVFWDWTAWLWMLAGLLAAVDPHLRTRLNEVPGPSKAMT